MTALVHSDDEVHPSRQVAWLQAHGLKIAMEIGAQEVTPLSKTKCLENTANNTVITMDGASWVLDLSGSSLYKVYKCAITMLDTWN